MEIAELNDESQESYSPLLGIKTIIKMYQRIGVFPASSNKAMTKFNSSKCALLRWYCAVVLLLISSKAVMCIVLPLRRGQQIDFMWMWNFILKGFGAKTTVDFIAIWLPHISIVPHMLLSCPIINYKITTQVEMLLQQLQLKAVISEGFPKTEWLTLLGLFMISAMWNSFWLNEAASQVLDVKLELYPVEFILLMIINGLFALVGLGPVLSIHLMFCTLMKAAARKCVIITEEITLDLHNIACEKIKMFLSMFQTLSTMFLAFILLHSLISCVFLTSLLYYVASTVLMYKDFEILNFYAIFFLMFMIFPMIIMIFNESSAVNQLVKNIHLLAVALSRKEVIDLNELSSKLSLISELRDIQGIDVFGFFTFNRGLLTSLLGLLLTYFIVLIQFKLDRN